MRGKCQMSVWIIVSLFLMVTVTATASGFELDLDDLFSDDFLVESEVVVADQVDEELHQQRVGIVGQMHTNSAYARQMARLDFLGPNEDQGRVQHTLGAECSVDIRQAKGLRALANLGVYHYPNGIVETNLVPVNIGGIDVEAPVTTVKHNDLLIHELFVDLHWNRQVYLRTGKQVLRWGRGYFWNPTDLINVERREFLADEDVRTGTFGVRLHLPFGMTRNFYAFADLEGAETLAEAALALRYEALLHNTEVAVSLWTKEGLQPVYGFDLSGRVGKIDIRGEIGVSHGDNRQMMDYDTLDLFTPDGWVPRISLGASRSFDVGDHRDRISLSGEFYYNHVGYDENIFDRLSTAPIAKRGEYLMEVYEPYRNSKYYLALFTHMRSFLHRDATLHINGIGNLVDRSATLSAGISYSPSFADVTVQLTGYHNVGDANTEANFHGNRYGVTVGTSLSF